MLRTPARIGFLVLGAALAVTASAVRGPIRQGYVLRAAEPAKDAAPGVIQIDTVVTDHQGQAIRDLRPDEFELMESGEPRTIESATLQSGGRRVVGIFLDDYHVAAGAHTQRVRDAMRRFVDSGLRAGDLVAIVRPLDPLNTIQPTDDLDIARAAIESFSGRKGDYEPRSPFEEQFISRSPKTASMVRAQVVTMALQALAARMGETRPGRKAVILASEGFTPIAARGSDRSQGALRTIVYAANRHGVAIHAANPAQDPSDAARTENEAGTLAALAQQTGGTVMAAGSDISEGLLRAVGDLDNHYLLTYRTATFQDGRFHPITVRVKRPGAQVRSRTGYWAPAVVNRRASVTPRSPAFPVRPPHSSPYIRPWIGTARAPDGLMDVIVAWEPAQIPPRNQQVDVVRLKAIAYDGRVLFDANIDGRDVDAAGALTKPPQRASFQAPAGPIALEMKVHGRDGSLLDTDYRTLQVPNLWAAKTMFATVQVIRTRNAREFTRASGDPDAVPTGSRQFTRMERLLIRASAYSEEGSTPALVATLLNPKGAPMRQLQAVTTGLPESIVQFDLPLASLAPGEYRVQLAATSTGQTHPEATELIVFRVAN